VGSYVVLARKWRPAQFPDIVGQGHIVRTLMNAIQAQRIHQAYLLTGSRGIGKTSIARIFAKAIRCEKAELRDGKLLSCNQCPSCKEIAGSTSVDVIEIDGASNNGVDAVREIRENAKFLPASGSRKIYIIDEVHMLTTAAFNALLKTLEEPPPHVIFVFATTEPHKIPATILSRCQRFDLRRVTVAQIQTRLAEVTAAEGIHCEPGALALIARAAEGSMRDALSLLDQVISFAGSKVSVEAVRDSVGLIEGQTLLGILQAILARKPADALKLVDEAYRQGHDLRVLARSLIEFLHAAILAKVGAAGSAALELSEEETKELQAIAALRPLEELELIFQALHHGVDWIARSPQPKIVLDVLLVKCATAEALVYADGATTGPAETQAPSAAAIPAAAPRPAPVRASAPEAPAPAAAPTPAPSLPTWESFIAHVRQTRPLLASILENATSRQDDDEIAILFPADKESFVKQLQNRVYAEQLAQLGREHFGRPVRFRAEIGEGGESLAERRERERRERETSARQAAQNHPIVNEARSLFGGELGPIEVVEQHANP
jgi:DNA polymerase-3 subunit gamma/tau